MSKYTPLWKYIKENKSEKLSFADIKNILGLEIDHSFLSYKKELNEYGYEIEKISIKNKYILIKEIQIPIKK